MTFDLTAARWIHPPAVYAIDDGVLTLTTEPETDLWQRTYYGFRNDNAPALLLESDANFTFTARTTFDYRTQFDQCGLLIYLDTDNWCKIGLEYEDASFSRLGSVVTNHGHSDWATTDMASIGRMWYRLSRRGPDFLVESSPDGTAFTQMRIFHLHALGTTTAEMGAADPPLPPAQAIRFGLYACSPQTSSFQARFDRLRLEPCRWTTHHAA